MDKDAKWYAEWLRMATAPTEDEIQFINEIADFIENLAAELEKVKRERDAAIKDIPRACGYCKHFLGFDKLPHCNNWDCKNISGINTGWEWRGLCVENGGAEK